MHHRPTKVRIDTSALHHNLARLKSWTGQAFFCPMIKANAYGHDEVLIARELQKAKVSAAGVALVEEGVRLRQTGIDIPLLVFSAFDRDGAQTMLRQDLTPVVERFADLDALAACHPKHVKVHVKFNTGMQRLGFDAHEIPALKKRLSELSFIEVEGTCTHLTHGEDAAQAGGPTAKQVALFEQMSAGFPGAKHVHKTSSLSTLQTKTGGFGARPGIGVYGLPYEGRAVGEGLKPVLSWHSEIINLHHVEKGEGVGYSARWVAPRKSTIAVLPLGYADGYMRTLSNKGEVLYRGQKVPVVGGVCMDYIFIDVTDAEKDGPAKPGEHVVLIGKQGAQEITAQDIAEKAGTIAYETVTCISRRVPREAV